MTNKERYQKTFRVLHASDRIMEVKEMKHTRHLPAGRFVPAAALLVFILGLSTVAYAANLGGIRKAVQIWIHGDLTDAVMEVQDGSYTLTYKDEHGNTQEREGGGVALEPGGRERPLTEAELMEELDCPEIEAKKDGTVWVYYQNQSLDITDKFEDNICYVKLIVKGKPIYMTIKAEGTNGYSYTTGLDSYPDPRILE